MNFEEALKFFKIGTHYKDASLENAKELPAKLINFAYSWLDSSIDSLYLYGSTGSGKTYFSICLLRELLRQKKNCLFINSLQLDRDLLLSVRDNSEYDETHLMRKYSQCDYLFIDDLGVESDSPRVHREYYEIINNRIIHEKITIISSNLSLDELSQKLGDRIASRVSSSFVVKFPDVDLRNQ